jgi:hypothetical protein
VVVITAANSTKARLLGETGRFSLCAQTEEPPYKYVSVEGAVTKVEPASLERDGRPMAHRYLGPELGDAYVESTRALAAGSVVIHMRPERWNTVDYGKEFATQAGS